MIVALLTLFAISLVLMVAGLFLSLKPRSSCILDRQEIVTTGRNRSMESSRRTSTQRVQRVGEVRRTYARRASMEFERRAWQDTLPHSSSNLGRIFNWHATMEARWLGIMLVLCVLFLLSMYLYTFIPSSPTLIAHGWADAPTSNSSSGSHAHAGSAISSSPSFSGQIGASKVLKRLSQLDSTQYSSTQEYSQWAYSACSAAAITEVINAYGHQFRITDILKIESGLGEITPDLGLVEPNGIDRTVVQFHFQTTWLHNSSLSDLINVANQGRPIIIGFPPSRWSGGHILVIVGGTKDIVYLADSSSYNMQAMAHTTFLKYWEGFAVVVTPK